MPRKKPHDPRITPTGGGHATVYPNKTRQLSVKVTEAASAVLAAAVKRTRLSASDIVEGALRAAAMRLDPNAMPQ